MLQAEKQVRFFDLARAFQAIAERPDKALNVALEIDDDTINVLESNLHEVARKLNGDPLATAIETLLSIPAPSIVPVSTISIPVSGSEAASPVWVKHGKRGAPAHEVRWEANWSGVKLLIQKRGPKNYEGFVNGVPVARGKFKSDLRDKVEKEAAKRLSA